jgi:hypothetical protein
MHPRQCKRVAAEHGNDQLVWDQPQRIECCTGSIPERAATRTQSPRLVVVEKRQTLRGAFRQQGEARLQC